MGTRMVCATPRRGKAPNNYSLGERIGRGAFATVHKAIDLRTGEFVAIKEIPLAKLGSVDSIMSEIELLQELEHPNIVKYLGFMKDQERLSIVLEYCENGSLAAIGKKFGSFPENLVAMYMRQVLEGLVYLHAQGTIHRDIKGGNILTTKDGVAKLADFGVATKTVAHGGGGALVGTPHWMAPEIIQLEEPTSACDIWSVGCTVVELRRGQPPYGDLPDFSAMYAVVQNDEMPIPNDASSSLADFLSLCFEKDPALRISAADLLEHRWIRKHNGYIAPNDAVKTVQKWNDQTRRRKLHVPSRVNLKAAYADISKGLGQYIDEDSFGEGFGTINVHESMSGRVDQDFELPLTPETPVAAPVPQQVPVRKDIQLYAEDGDSFDEDFAGGSLGGLKLANINANSSIDPFRGLESLNDSQNERLAAAQEETEKLCRALSAGKTQELDLKYARLCELIIAEPSVKQIIIGNDHFATCLAALRNSPTHAEPILDLLHLLMERDSSAIESFSLAGGLSVIFNFVGVHDCKVAQLLWDICQGYEFGARLLASRDDSLSTLCNYVSPKLELDVLRLATCSLMAVFHQFGPRKRTELWQQFGRFSLIEKVIETLEPVCHVAGVDEAATANLFDLLSSFSKTPPMVAEKHANRRILRLLMRCYRHLPETAHQRQVILTVFKEFSRMPKVIAAMQAGQLERYFVDILRRSFSESSLHQHSIATCVLPILFNYCRLSGDRQYEAARSGLIPLLMETPSREPTLKDFALPTLCAMAHNAKCRIYLWTADAMGFLLRLVTESGYEATAAAALAAWLDGEPAKATKRFLALSGAQALVIALKNTRADAFAGVVSTVCTMLDNNSSLRQAISARAAFAALRDHLIATPLEGPPLVRTLQVIVRILEAQPTSQADLHSTGLAAAIEHFEMDMPMLAQNLAEQILN